MFIFLSALTSSINNQMLLSHYNQLQKNLFSDELFLIEYAGRRDLSIDENKSS